MATIFKFFRIVFFLALYFVLCMFLVVTVLQEWSIGAQMAFAFGVPLVLVWWGEKRRSKREPESDGKQIHGSRTHGRDQGPARQRGKRTEGFSANSEVQNRRTIGAYSPPKQDYSTIVQTSKKFASIRSEAPKNEKQTKKAASRYKATRRTGWVPSSDAVIVAGRDIGGMVYVGTPPRLNDYGYQDKCRAYIDPSLSVARSGQDKAGVGMPYWPGYSDISPQCRATYLDWLAGGRSDASFDAGYMFLYFYGLERRFFVDQSNPDAQDIVEEVRRLRAIYFDNHSARRYLGEFLDIAMLAETELEALEPVFERQGWELPFSLKYAIGARLDKGEKLAADWLLSWFICHPESNLRTAATRCREEFLALFKKRFDARFPEGLKVAKPRKTLKATYRAASSEFEGMVNPTLNGKPVPDISGLHKPVEIAQEIADEVMDDLAKLSRFLGRNPDARGSLEAQALLPQELWGLFPSEELNQLKSWAADIVALGGLVQVSDVINRLEGALPDKLTKRQLTGAADALARVGFGFAPDPRFALRSPKIGEPVALFDLGEAVAKLEDVSPEYREALVEAALGSFIAHADGKITKSERRSLLAKASFFSGLSGQEHRRLSANIEWMLSVAPDLALLRRKLKDTGLDAQASVRSVLVAAAHADGVIQSEEVAGMEKVYKALGLDPALVYSDLHAGGVSDGPVRVRAAEAGAVGEAIPSESLFRAPKLDTARIAAIQSDTQRVSAVLGEIFDDTATITDASETKPAPFNGLDEKHTTLVRELIAQDHWTEDAFQELCLRSGLLASGAMEDINEWAYEAYDEALLDEYDGYDVAPEIAGALKRKFEEETSHV